VNDLTNKELIRRNFKFEERLVPEDKGANHEEADAIFEGSTVMNASHIFDHGLLDVRSSVKGSGKSKDLTDEMLTFREQKGIYFRCKILSSHDIL
jgi:hypothetical protein